MIPVVKLPNCQNCKYYLRKNISPALNECKRFKWYFRNEVRYEKADYCRSEEDLCGINGYFFREKEDK